MMQLSLSKPTQARCVKFPDSYLVVSPKLYSPLSAFCSSTRRVPSLTYTV
jgi:hypothetical protein